MTHAASKPRLDFPLAVALLVLAVQLAAGSARFSEGSEGIISGGFTGDILRNWDRFGFVAVGGRPIRLSWPTAEVSGWTTLNHPPFLYWAIRAVSLPLGGSELSIRLLSIVATSGTVLLVLRSARESFGPKGAAAAAAALLVSPMFWEYGRMAGFEPPIIFCGCVAFRAAARTSAAQWRWGVFLPVFAATAIDWMGVAAGAVAAAIGAASGGGRAHRRAVALSSLAAAAAGVGLTLATYVAWTGSFAEVARQLRAAFESASPGPAALGRAFAAQAGFIARLYGIPVLVFAVAGLALLPRLLGTARAVALQILGWTAMWLAYVAGFPGRSDSHDFWSIYALPGVALAAAAAVAFAFTLRRSWIRNVVLAAAGVGALMHAWNVGRAYAATRDDAWKLAQAINAGVPSDSLFLFQFEWAPGGWVWRHYAAAVARPAFELDASNVVIRSPADLPTREDEAAAIRSAAERFLAGSFTARRLFVALKPGIPTTPGLVEWLESRGFRRSNLGGTVLLSRER